MPIFEFQCRQCNHIYEALVMSGDNEDIQCPKCGDKNITKLISKTGSLRKSDSGTLLTGSSSSCGDSGFS